MSRTVAVCIVFVLMATSASVLAQSDGATDVPKGPQPLPAGPDTDRFYIFGALTHEEEQGNLCAHAVRGLWGEQKHDVLLYASNDAEDPCRTIASATDTAYSVAGTTTVAKFGFTTTFYPSISNGTPLREGEPFKLNLVLAITRLNDQAYGQLSFGDVQPRFVLTVEKEVIAQWDADAPVSIETVNGPESDTVYHLTYDVAFGSAPAILPAGILNLTVDLTNRYGANSTCYSLETDACLPQFRRLASKVGLSIHPDRQGWIEIPFAEGADQYFPKRILPKTTSPGLDNNTTGNGTGNETIPSPSPTPTEDADNNTTVKPNEKGFLPGFGTVLLLSASLFALVFHARGRPPVKAKGPPPMRLGR